MASKRTAAAVLLTLLSLAVGAAQEAEGPKPLVRKDLLVLGTGEIDPPLRDIFRPKPAAASGRPARPSVRPSPSALEPEPAPTFALTISYVGSIKSGGRIIALVLRGGQTLPVSEGDEIVPGYRVLRVTAEAVVVRGPTGETRTFAKQGDRP